MRIMDCNQNQETCVYIKFPAVVGETTVQHIVQSVTCITGGALKIDHIEASVKEIDWDILDGKVVSMVLFTSRSSM